VDVVLARETTIAFRGFVLQLCSRVALMYTPRNEHIASTCSFRLSSRHCCRRHHASIFGSSVLQIKFFLLIFPNRGFCDCTHQILSCSSFVREKFGMVLKFTAYVVHTYDGYVISLKFLVHRYVLHACLEF
jgi:hypothetical protein